MQFSSTISVVYFVQGPHNEANPGDNQHSASNRVKSTEVASRPEVASRHDLRKIFLFDVYMEINPLTNYKYSEYGMYEEEY